MLAESPTKPYALAPITFLTAAIRAELADLRAALKRPGVATDPVLVAKTTARVLLLLEQLDRHGR